MESYPQKRRSFKVSKRSALQFVVLLGVVSLFADMTYEGARSITGQYLAILGASGAVVGCVAGLGELIGYGFRLISGYVSDKSQKYWLITIFGYLLNLFAAPLLALAGNWEMAAGLIILERLGKAIRSPAKDAMLSYATKEMGRGWGFGLHEALDQIGAIIGPLFVSCMLYFHESYQMSFAMLVIPALLALLVLVVARMCYAHPQDLEVENPAIKTEGLSKKYWLYVSALCLVALGYVDFPLIAYHFKKAAIISDSWMPIFFSIAMAAAGLSSLIFGRWYDKKGFSVLILASALSCFFPVFVFLSSFSLALFGMVLWGIGIGAQESIMRAYVASLVAKNKRGTAYGILNIWFGLFWFLGSALMGFLYDISFVLLVAFSVVCELAATVLFTYVRR